MKVKRKLYVSMLFEIGDFDELMEERKQADADLGIERSEEELVDSFLNPEDWEEYVAQTDIIVGENLKIDHMLIISTGDNSKY